MTDTTALEYPAYDQKWYEDHKAAGLDYLIYGYWQQSYARMVCDTTLQESEVDPFIIDIGCACGTQLNGFKETGLFKGYLGIDISDHMIALGRDHFHFAADQLMVGKTTGIPIRSGAASLVHCTQVLEHIYDHDADSTVSEISRVLRPGGRAFIILDAVRHGETKEIYLGEPTHVNIQPVSYWTKKFIDVGLTFDVEAYNRFARSSRGPTEGDPHNFFETYPYWSTWTLIKL